MIDGHVHVHPSYDASALLALAKANLSRLGEGQPVLLLTEMAGVDVFATWKAKGETLDDTAAVRIDGVVVCAGRQIVTRERIEVLSLLSEVKHEDGQPLDDTIAAVKSSGGLVVLPWGVGKWSGARGQRVAEAARQHGVMLGDNAGRPIGWPRPKVYGEFVVLPGSDPLRMAREQSIVGTYGFKLTGDPRNPGAAIRALTHTPTIIGSRVNPLRFVRQQVGLRLSK